MPLDEKTKMLMPAIVEVGKRYHASRIVLFGSRARGDNSAKSDFDLAVYGAVNKDLRDKGQNDLHIAYPFATGRLPDEKQDGLGSWQDAAMYTEEKYRI